jgi:hypothetical protein
MSWQTPDTWQLGDGVSATRLNKVSDNLEYLLKPDMFLSTIRNASDITKALTTYTAPVAVDDTQFTLTFAAKANTRLLIGISLPYVISATAVRTIRFDWLMDDTTYLSSNTTSPLAGGLFNTGTIDTATGGSPAYSQFVYDSPTEDTHTWKLRAWGNASTTMTLALAGLCAQMYVREI